MKFRKIYWVTEQLAEDGTSQVAGVYTSVADLVSRGTSYRDGVPGNAGFRLTLVQLDSTRAPLGSWTSPEFAGLEEAWEEYIASNELTLSELESLRAALDQLGAR